MKLSWLIDQILNRQSRLGRMDIRAGSFAYRALWDAMIGLPSLSWPNRHSLQYGDHLQVGDAYFSLDESIPNNFFRFGDGDEVGLPEGEVLK